MWPAARIFTPRSLFLSAIVAFVYYLAGKAGLYFALVSPNVSPVWPASGFALAAVLLLGSQVWPGVFVGAFLVNFFVSGHPAVSLAIAAGNAYEALLGAYLINRFNQGRQGFERPSDTWRFAAASLVATMVTATVGAVSVHLAFGAASFAVLWLTWWLGDTVGVLVVAPLILLWAHDHEPRWKREQVVEGMILLGAIVLLGEVLFGGWIPDRFQSYPLDFLFIPLFVWVAFRFGQREAATSIVVLSWIALKGTLAGSGPFAGSSPNESLLLLQLFLGLTSLFSLVLAAVVSESRRGHEATERIATIVKSANDAIVTKTLNGTITSWNPAAEKLFGYTADEAIGQNITFIIPQERHPEELMVLTKIGRGEVVDQFDTVRVRKDGSSVDISLTVSPLRSADGSIIGASKIARDITDRIRLEEVRNNLLAREQQAHADAVAGNRAKDEFLAILSHELRTPLNAVYGWARMMQTRQLDEETSVKALDAIVRNSNAQVQLIDDLLDVSRVINGKMRLEIHPADINDAIRAALDAVGHAAADKHLHLEADLDPRGIVVNCDPGRVQQIVWNLAMNAVKFTPAGGHVKVALNRTSDHVEIVVSDTGQGISAQVLPYVFDRFRQWDSSSTREHRGLGLGLALVKHLTELHRGTVSAESAGEGKGSTFKVTLPLTVASGMLPARTSAVSGFSTVNGARLDGLRILAVDDDADALELAATILMNAGASVKTARSAADALATLKGWRPDVLVSDIDMPGEDGYSLIRKVRGLEAIHGGRTPAVALTALGRAEDRARSLSAGYSMHLPKPVDPEEFTTIIASIARVLRSRSV